MNAQKRLYIECENSDRTATHVFVNTWMCAQDVYATAEKPLSQCCGTFFAECVPNRFYDVFMPSTFCEFKVELSLIAAWCVDDKITRRFDRRIESRNISSRNAPAAILQPRKKINFK